MGKNTPVGTGTFDVLWDAKSIKKDYEFSIKH